jgi:hypothetical protein
MSEGYASLVMSGIDDYLLREGDFDFVASQHNKPDLIHEYLQMLIERALEGQIFLNTPVTRAPSVPAVSISGHVPAAKKNIEQLGQFPQGDIRRTRASGSGIYVCPEAERKDGIDKAKSPPAWTSRGRKV